MVELSRNSRNFSNVSKMRCTALPLPSNQLRSKDSFSSQLDGIEGWDPKRKQKIMKHFKSLAKIKKPVWMRVVRYLERLKGCEEIEPTEGPEAFTSSWKKK